MLSVSIKAFDGHGLQIVSHIQITEIEGEHERGEEWADFKYIIQEPDGSQNEGHVPNVKYSWGALKLLALVLSAAGHYGEMVSLPADRLAQMIGAEKLEEVQDALDEKKK